MTVRVLDRGLDTPSRTPIVHRDTEVPKNAEDTPEQLLTLWQDAVVRSRSSVAEALSEGGLDQLARFTWPDGRTPSLRRILIDLIEEYARHVGSCRPHPRVGGRAYRRGSTGNVDAGILIEVPVAIEDKRNNRQNSLPSGSVATDSLSDIAQINAADPSLATRHGAHDLEGLSSDSNLIGQGSVRRFMGEVLLTSVEPQERSALMRNTIADRSPQRWIARLESVDNCTLRDSPLDVE